VASRGAILCVDALFCSNAISKYAAQTMNFVQLGSLEADVIIQLLTQYPSMLAVLRVSRIKYRMEVEVKSYAAAIKIVRREVEEQRCANPRLTRSSRFLSSGLVHFCQHQSGPLEPLVCPTQANVAIRGSIGHHLLNAHGNLHFGRACASFGLSRSSVLKHCNCIRPL